MANPPTPGKMFDKFGPPPGAPPEPPGGGFPGFKGFKGPPDRSPTDLEKYSDETFKPLDPVLTEIVDRAKELGIPGIHVGGMEGRAMQVMIRMAGYKKAVEVGTLAGFSGVVIARALGPGGVLHTIDCNADCSEVAKESFKKAGVADIVKVHVGNALDVLEALSPEGPFDAVFIDADKGSYPKYLAWAEKNLRVGGAVFGDNTHGMRGMVYRDDLDSSDWFGGEVNAVREFNSRLANNPSFLSVIIPFPQGMTVGLKIR